MQSHQDRSWSWMTELFVHALMLAAVPVMLGALYLLFLAANALSGQLIALFGMNWTSAMYLILGGCAIGVHAIRIKYFPEFGRPISPEEMPEAWRAVWAMVALLLLIVVGSEAVRWMLGF